MSATRIRALETASLTLLLQKTRGVVNRKTLYNLLEVVRENVDSLPAGCSLQLPGIERAKLARDLFNPRQITLIPYGAGQRVIRNRDFRYELRNEGEVKKENLPYLDEKLVGKMFLQLVEVIDYVVISDLLSIPDNRDFVRACYRAILRKDADQGGLAHFCYQLSVGASREDVVSEIYYTNFGVGDRPVLLDDVLQKEALQALPQVFEAPSDLLFFSLDGARESKSQLRKMYISSDINRDTGIFYILSPEYIVHGPKVSVSEGRYLMTARGKVEHGSLKLDVVAFGGAERLFEIEVTGDFSFSVIIEVKRPCDLVEGRVETRPGATGGCRGTLELFRMEPLMR